MAKSTVCWPGTLSKSEPSLGTSATFQHLPMTGTEGFPGTVLVERHAADVTALRNPSARPRVNAFIFTTRPHDRREVHVPVEGHKAKGPSLGLGDPEERERNRRRPFIGGPFHRARFVEGDDEGTEAKSLVRGQLILQAPALGEVPQQRQPESRDA